MAARASSVTAAFEDPTTPANARRRESIEVRTMAFFDATSGWRSIGRPSRGAVLIRRPPADSLYLSVHPFVDRRDPLAAADAHRH